MSAIMAWLSAEHTEQILNGRAASDRASDDAQAGKNYVGTRIGASRLGHVSVVAPDGTTRALDRRLDLRNHSPDGFAWGYSGSGPSQLALALCADALGDDERAERIYHAFKFRLVANMTEDTFKISQAEIVAAVAELERERTQ